jgi:hypothetical protein
MQGNLPHNQITAVQIPIGLNACVFGVENQFSSI